MGVGASIDNSEIRKWSASEIGHCQFCQHSNHPVRTGYNTFGYEPWLAFCELCARTIESRINKVCGDRGYRNDGTDSLPSRPVPFPPTTSRDPPLAVSPPHSALLQLPISVHSLRSSNTSGHLPLDSPTPSRGIISQPTPSPPRQRERRYRHRGGYYLRPQITKRSVRRTLFAGAHA